MTESAPAKGFDFYCCPTCGSPSPGAKYCIQEAHSGGSHKGSITLADCIWCPDLFHDGRGINEPESHGGLGSAVDDNRTSQQSDHAGTPITHHRSSSIFVKDAEKWLRKRWPYRPMTTGGLPDECLLPHFQPTRKDIERWLAEYAEEALPYLRRNR